MSDFMTARLPESESDLPAGIEIVSTTVLKDRTDPERMSVKFVIAADSPAQARRFTQEPALINEGLRIVRREGLASPGINESGIPVACDETGEPSGNPMGTIDPNVARRYFYTVTYRYLGED